MLENENKTTDSPIVMNPGETISPQGAPLAAPLPEQIVAAPTPETTQSFAFNQEEAAPDTQPLSEISGDFVEWVASEFIYHEKTTNWYLSMAGVTALIAGIIFLVTKDFVSTGVIIFGAILFGVYASRKPRQMPYRVDDKGVQIGDKSFLYSEFRGFSVVQEGAFSSLVLSPLKRFSPLTSIYYPPEAEESITSIIANHLPVENRKQDSIDKLMHLIGF